jgi:hypothetical protein
MIGDMATKDARIKVIAATWPKADGESYRFAFVEIFLRICAAWHAESGKSQYSRPSPERVSNAVFHGTPLPIFSKSLSRCRALSMGQSTKLKLAFVALQRFSLRPKDDFLRCLNGQPQLTKRMVRNQKRSKKGGVSEGDFSRRHFRLFCEGPSASV